MALQPCVGQYVRRSDKQRIAEAKAAGVPPFEIGPSYNVAPQTFQPVVRLNRDTGDREIVLMRWGLVPFWSKDQKIAYSAINAKNDDSALIDKADPAKASFFG